MRIALITDAWHPQLNGVVHTLGQVVAGLRRAGDTVDIIHPGLFPNLPCPGYGEIRLALAGATQVGRHLDRCAPDAVHIATEGPLGWAARRHCLRRGWGFTTAYHTHFPDYLHARCRLPRRVSYALLRHFHRPAGGVLVATEALAASLARHWGPEVALKLWSRGVDTDLFRRRADAELPGPGPHWLCVGRVAVEKNLPAFLALDLPGTKHVVGDGPARRRLEARFPDARFHGIKRGADLAQIYAGADVFVFPSRTDTFGLVLLEALAAGVPVAAFPAEAPRAVLGDAPVGVLDDDLTAACRRALTIDRQACRDFASRHSWHACTQRFRALLHSRHDAAGATA